MQDIASSLIETVRHPMAVLDADLTVISANPRFYQLIGGQPKGVLGRSLYEIDDGRWDIAGLRKRLQEVVLRDASVEDFEICWERPPLRRQFVRLSARRMISGEDESPRVWLSIEDDTERRQTQEKLAQLDGELKERVKELAAHRRAANLQRREDLSIPELLHEFASLLPPAWRHPERAAARVRFAGQEAETANFRESSSRLSASFCTSDGQQGSLEVVYPDGPPPGAGPLFLDDEQRLIDALAEMLGSQLERLRAQAGKRTSDQRYRLLFDSTPYPMWVYDRKSLRYLDANETAILHYGYTREQFLQMTLRDIRPPEDLPALEDAVRGLRTGSIFSGRMRHTTRDGRILPVEITAHGVDLDGVPAGIVMAQDVTERLDAEEDRWRTANLLQAVAENSTDAMFVKDSVGRYLLCNHAAAKFIGRPVEEILGKDDRALFGPARASIIMKRDRRAIELGQVMTEEEQLSSDGVTRIFLSTKAPLRDAAGDIAGLIGIARDVTEGKQAQDALRSSEQRFRAFMDNTPTLAWLSDAEGRIIFANAAYQRTIAVPQTSLTNCYVSDLFPDEYANVYLENIRRVAESGEVLETIEAGPRSDGSVGEFLVYKFPIVTSDRAIEVGAVAVDVTERKQMEETLRLRDRVIGAATQGILITDSTLDDNPIVYVSPGFERLTGYTSEEVVGRNCRFLQGPDTDPETKVRLRHALRAEEPCTVEILNYRKDGTPFWNELSISPVRDSSGRMTHYVGVQSDVTDRRRLEQQFLHAQKMEAVGQLAGGIAHDFNNLLTIINGYCDVLLEQTSPEAPDWEPLEEIRIAGERSANLTRQLLAFSRRQMLALEILDLNAIIRNTEKMLRRLIGEDITLTTKLADGLLPVKADAGQLEQILLNFAVNARDAMPTGGQLSVETENVNLSEEYAQMHPAATSGSHVMLAVSDTGCGMSSTVRSRVFEPFFTTKKSGQGTGLGLSVVHGIVSQLGGHVEVFSEPGNGTIFKIFLPCRRESLRRQEESVEPQSLPRGTETVLLVEDEAGVRALATRTLQRCGYTVLEAANGEAALRLAGASTEPIDLLVTDVVMPGESGPQIAVRLSASFDSLRVLFLSGYTDDTIVRHGVLQNKVHFLQKPYSALHLAVKVREVLDAPPAG